MELPTRGDEITDADLPSNRVTGPAVAKALYSRRRIEICVLLNVMPKATGSCSFTHMLCPSSAFEEREALVVGWRNGHHPLASTESRRQDRCGAHRRTPFSMPRAPRLHYQLDSVPRWSSRHCVWPGTIQVFLTPSSPDRRRFCCRSEAYSKASFVFAACHRCLRIGRSRALSVLDAFLSQYGCHGGTRSHHKLTRSQHSSQED